MLLDIYTKDDVTTMREEAERLRLLSAANREREAIDSTSVEEEYLNKRRRALSQASRDREMASSLRDTIKSRAQERFATQMGSLRPREPTTTTTTSTPQQAPGDMLRPPRREDFHTTRLPNPAQAQPVRTFPGYKCHLLTRANLERLELATVRCPHNSVLAWLEATQAASVE